MGYRTEDHLCILQSMIQLARADRIPLYILFVDLRKAYDGIDRTLLY